MKYAFTLDYHLPEGRLAPYFDALRKGRARASHCDGCGGVFFPARIRCSQCRVDCRDWRELSGRAEVLVRAGGGDGRFALARFEGASCLATVALVNPAVHATRGVLVAPPDDDRPGLYLRLIEGND